MQGAGIFFAYNRFVFSPKRSWPANKLHKNIFTFIEILNKITHFSYMQTNCSCFMCSPKNQKIPGAILGEVAS